MQHTVIELDHCGYAKQQVSVTALRGQSIFKLQNALSKNLRDFFLQFLTKLTIMDQLRFSYGRPFFQNRK